MPESIKKYSDVPEIYWIKQRSGKDYIYVEQRKPDDPSAVPAHICTEPNGLTEVHVHIEDLSRTSPTATSVAPVAETDPVAAKRSRLLALKGILPHYLNEAAVKSLFETRFKKTANGYIIIPEVSTREDATKRSADGAIEWGVVSGKMSSEADSKLTENIRFIEMSSVGQAFELIKHMLRNDEIVLDLEFGVPMSQDLRNFQYAINLLRSLDISLDSAQVNSARRRLGEASAKQIVDKIRASVDNFVLIRAKFDIAHCSREAIVSDDYDLTHVHVDSDRIGKVIKFTARLAKQRMHDAAREVCEERANRGSNRELMLCMFGTVFEANDDDGALEVSVNPIVIFSPG